MISYWLNDLRSTIDSISYIGTIVINIRLKDNIDKYNINYCDVSLNANDIETDGNKININVSADVFNSLNKENCEKDFIKVLIIIFSCMIL